MDKLCITILILVLSGCTGNPDSSIERRVISTDKAPAAVGIYSQAIEVGNRLFLSGQIGLVPETRKLAGESLESQTHQTLRNIKAVLNAADYRMSDVVEAQVFLSDLNDYKAFNTIYLEYFPENPPARAVVEVSRIPLDAKVEIKVSAARTRR